MMNFSVGWSIKLTKSFLYKINHVRLQYNLAWLNILIKYDIDILVMMILCRTSWGRFVVIFFGSFKVVSRTHRKERWVKRGFLVQYNYHQSKAEILVVDIQNVWAVIELIFESEQWKAVTIIITKTTST